MRTWSRRSSSSSVSTISGPTPRCARSCAGSEDGYYYNFTRASRHPGLYNVDTSSGFELVDAGGTAKLWKITACGDVTPGGGREAFVTGVTGDRD